MADKNERGRRKRDDSQVSVLCNYTNKKKALHLTERGNTGGKTSSKFQG